MFATDSNGAVVWTASYLPFGGVHASTGDPINSSGLRPFTAETPHRGVSGTPLTPRPMVPVRDYDPTTGRYMQADPLGLVDGASVYGYARQNPGRYVDPRGERTIYLGSGGWIIDRDWYLDPRMPTRIGNIFGHRCSNAEAVWHWPDGKQPGHWHYYPNGFRSGGRKGAVDRWRDSTGNDHLYSPYFLDVEDCGFGPSDGETAIVGVLSAATLIALLSAGSGTAISVGLTGVAVSQ